MRLVVDFVGEVTDVPEEGWLTIGRDADVAVDDNPYLHRVFLMVGFTEGFPWIVNAGDQLSATVSDPAGSFEAWLAPGARLPIVFERTMVRFTAGPTAYEFELVMDDAVFSEPVKMPDMSGDTTVGMVPLTYSQRLLVVALAEPVLRREGRSSWAIPSSAVAARRLGWTTTKFNRKLDNVCQKLAKVGVRGLHGGPGELASNRRSRLVEYAVSVRLVTTEDLVMLDSLDVDGQDDGAGAVDLDE